MQPCMGNWHQETFHFDGQIWATMPSLASSFCPVMMAAMGCVDWAKVRALKIKVEQQDLIVLQSSGSDKGVDSDEDEDDSGDSRSEHS